MQSRHRVSVLKNEMPSWKGRILEFMREMPTATEDADRLARHRGDVRQGAARCSSRSFKAQGGKNGRLSIQTDPRYYRDTEAIVEQAVRFSIARTEHDRQNPRHARGYSGDRGSDLPRYQHQRDRVTLRFRSALPSQKPWSEASTRRERRQRHLHHGPGLHHHGRPPGRLAEGGDGEGEPSAPIRATSNGPAWLFSRRHTRFSASADIASACFRPHSAITCTGASSSAATSSSLRRAPGSAVQRERHRSHSADRHSRRARIRDDLLKRFGDFRRALGRWLSSRTKSSIRSDRRFGRSPVHRSLHRFIVLIRDVMPNPDLE